MKSGSRIYVAGRTKLIGSALARRLESDGMEVLGREPDYTDARDVDAFFQEQSPEYVIIAAGKSGGIQANQERPAELMRDNLQAIQHILPAAHRYGVKKLAYLASSCVYPRLCAQPMEESDLWTGPLEPTNASYATAKLTGLQLCRAYRQQHGAPFIGIIPTNLFGPGDTFDPENSHVVSALIRRMDDAKRDGADHIDIWGTGTPRREFMPVDAFADACVHVMCDYDEDEPINIGSGEAHTIAELAEAIRGVVGFDGELRFDTSKLDGMPEKVLDVTKLTALGWTCSADFRSALEETYAWYCQSVGVPVGQGS